LVLLSTLFDQLVLSAFGEKTRGKLLIFRRKGRGKRGEDLLLIVCEPR